MCGISAIIKLDESPVSVEHIKAMTDSVRHRGPDDEGYLLANTETGKYLVAAGQDTSAEVLDATLPYAPKKRIEDAGVLRHKGYNLALGHRRLSIIDLASTGHQPMSNKDGTIWIVHNGEVYNYLELRQELEDLGYHFNSSTDTEVILNAYDAWADDCLDRFNGMWAFVIVDTRRRRLFAARDRFGIKPLYYLELPGHLLAFASEIKQLTLLPGFQSRLNAQRAYDFLVFGTFDHTSETLFSGVKQLRGGESLVLSLDRSSKGYGQLTRRRWWDLQEEPIRDLSLDQAADHFLELFTDSIRLRLRADVPIGSCLSGGLDSSAIVCVANRLLRDKDANTVQKTFSSCFADKKYDEREYIATIVGITGVDAHYTFPSADTLFDLIDSIAFHQDEPYGSTSIYAQWHVFKLAAENGVRVMLDGQGGDEQLAGYHSFYGPFFATMVRKGKLGRLVHEIIAYCRLHNYSPYRAFRVMLGHMMPMSLSIPVKNKRDKSRIPSWLNWRGWAEEGVEPYFRKSLADRTYKSNPFNKLSYQQLVQAGLPMLLHWEDRASMAHSVESRVPFLDYRLVNFVFNLPAEYKIRKGYTKELLRRSMIGTLPETVRRRVDKMGFVTPEEIWLRGPLKEYFRHEIESITRSYKGFVQQKRLQDLLEDVITGKRGFDKTIWRLVSFHRWMKRFNVS